MSQWACMGKLSKIWMGYYEAVNLETNSPVVVCKKCLQEYQHPRWKNDSSTSTIKKYFGKHENIKPQVIGAGSIERYIRTSSLTSSLTQPELDKLLLQTLAACNWPFNQFNNSQFQYFINRVLPNHHCPGRKQIRNLLKKEADIAREDIKERLITCTSRVSLALDCWSSSNSYNFISMTICSLHKANCSNHLSLC